MHHRSKGRPSPTDGSDPPRAVWILRHYDQYEYLDEKRDALERWAAKVASIVTPPPANVVQLRPEEAA